jgi:hypothetical protein
MNRNKLLGRNAKLAGIAALLSLDPPKVIPETVVDDFG